MPSLKPELTLFLHYETVREMGRLGKLTEIIFEEMRSLEQNLTFGSAKMFAERDVNCVKRHGRRSFYLQKMRVTKSASVNRPI